MLRLPGRRSELREFSDEHAKDPRYREWLRDLDVVRQLGRLEYQMPLAPDAVDRYVAQMRSSDVDCFFAVHVLPGSSPRSSPSEPVKDGAFVGTAKLGHIDWRTGVADVGVLIGAREQWGKGLATDAVRTLCRYAFDELGLRRLTGGTPATNTAMIKCFERVGFQHEGKRRAHLRIGNAWVDHVLFGLMSNELTA